MKAISYTALAIAAFVSLVFVSMLKPNSPGAAAFIVIGEKHSDMNEARPTFSYVAPVFRVTDLARSIAFYSGQLGFEVDFSYENFYASVHRDGCYIHLNCASPAARDQAAFERAEHIDACAVISGAEALASEYSAAGVAFSVPLRRQPYGIEFYVRDPDGYIIGFVQPASDDKDA